MTFGGHGFGNVGLGVTGEPAPFRLRPDLCVDEGHPGATFNPWSRQTWCLCGLVIRPGNTVLWPKADGIGGPLREDRKRKKVPVNP